MEEVTEIIPKGEGAASAALSHLVPQRRLYLPPVSDNRSMATMPRSWPGSSLSPAYRIPLSAGSRRRHDESLPAIRKIDPGPTGGSEPPKAQGSFPVMERRGTFPPAPAKPEERTAPGRRGSAATGLPRPRRPTYRPKGRSRDGAARGGRRPLGQETPRVTRERRRMRLPGTRPHAGRRPLWKNQSAA